MKDVQAIVCFDIAEPQVDDLIEVTRGTNFWPARWLVFGRDMPRLAGLVAQWQDSLDLTVALFPGASEDTQHSALLILENEGVTLSGCIWLQSADTHCPLPPTARSVRIESFCTPQDSLSRMRRLAIDKDAGSSRR